MFTCSQFEQGEEEETILEFQSSGSGRKRIFSKELRCMMYGFGDDQNPYTESVDLLEDLAIEFITNMVSFYICSIIFLFIHSSIVVFFCHAQNLLCEHYGYHLPLVFFICLYPVPFASNFVDLFCYHFIFSHRLVTIAVFVYYHLLIKLGY